MDIVQHCHLNISVEDIEHLYFKEVEYPFNKEQQQCISKEISKLLQLKVIQVTQRTDDQIISPIFLRKKPNGEYRLVLNLKELNLHIPYKHFKMENFEQAIKLIHAGDYLASVDLRHAYYSVKVAEEQQKFLCFTWHGTVYKFTCLPNGISEGPRLFTKLMKPVFATLRKKGYRITSFIDDTLIIHSTRSGCLESINDTITLLRSLGFYINEEKSVLIPTKCIEYLGNVIDTESMKIYLPERRLDKVTQGCKALLSKERHTIRGVARVIGMLVAATPAVELGKLHYRKLEAAKIAALKEEKGDFNRKMTITNDMREDLNWWINNVSIQDRQIFRTGPDIELYTDASRSGWGGHLDQQTVSGNWSREEKHLHINALELKAILLTLQTFTLELRDRHIKVFCDNTTAISYVNEMGGSKSQTCNNISIEIWDWCVGNNSWIICSHIPGKDNVIADIASRKINDRHEWKLGENIFRELSQVFGTPSIDLFASRINKQVSTFCSWKPDPEAKYFDAFSFKWTQFQLCYIFPPFSLITRCLQKLKAEVAKGWMVVPLWTSQPWMGTLLQLLVDHPRLIMGKDVLTHPSTAEPHPLLKHTSLMACLLSGNPYENRAYLQRAQKSLWHPGNLAQRSSTGHTSEGGPSFVIDGISIPLIPLHQK